MPPARGANALERSDMRVFLDTEFTSLESPQLLSIGLVSDVGLECYVELDLESTTGQRRIAEASPFALLNVLSQWRRERVEREVTEHLGFAAAGWLERMAQHFSDDIELICPGRVDADLAQKALQSAGRRWSRIESRLEFSIVSYLNLEPIVEAAMHKSWADSRTFDGTGRHHALADARALRAGFHAMHGASDEALMTRRISSRATKSAAQDVKVSRASGVELVRALLENPQRLRTELPADVPGDRMEAVSDLVEGVLAFAKSAGDSGSHSIAELQKLRFMAERVRST